MWWGSIGVMKNILYTIILSFLFSSGVFANDLQAGNDAHDAENKRCAESLTRWWPGTESNCRHKDFQSSALPTELPGLCYFLRKKTRIKPI